MATDEFTFLGTMGEDFRITPMASGKLARLLHKYVNHEKSLEVTISIHRKQRSLAQNRWMHGVCVPTVQGWLRDTQGEKFTREEVYVYINTVALRRKPEIKDIAGDEVIVMAGKRFSQMTTLEFSEAVDEIVNYFDERGLEVKLPKPNTNNLVSDYLNDE